MPSNMTVAKLSPVTRICFWPSVHPNGALASFADCPHVRRIGRDVDQSCNLGIITHLGNHGTAPRVAHQNHSRPAAR